MLGCQYRAHHPPGQVVVCARGEQGWMAQGCPDPHQEQLVTGLGARDVSGKGVKSQRAAGLTLCSSCPLFWRCYTKLSLQPAAAGPPGAPGAAANGKRAGPQLRRTCAAPALPGGAQPWHWALPFPLPLILLADREYCCLAGQGRLWLFPDTSQWGLYFLLSLHSTESPQAGGCCKGKLVRTFPWVNSSQCCSDEGH